MSLDANGYPTEETLERLRTYDLVAEPLSGLLALIEENWWNPGWGYLQVRSLFELHTAGWSGNEDVIHALTRNFLFWSQCWVSSRRGGHYYFEIPKRWRS